MLYSCNYPYGNSGHQRVKIQIFHRSVCSQHRSLQQALNSYAKAKCLLLNYRPILLLLLALRLFLFAAVWHQKVSCLLQCKVVYLSVMSHYTTTTITSLVPRYTQTVPRTYIWRICLSQSSFLFGNDKCRTLQGAPSYPHYPLTITVKFSTLI